MFTVLSKSLSAKLLFPVLVVLIITGAIATTLAVMDSQNSSSVGLQEKAKLVGTVTTSSLGSALWNLDSDAGNGTLESMSIDPDIVFAIVLDAQGGLFVTRSKIQKFDANKALKSWKLPKIKKAKTKDNTGAFFKKDNRLIFQAPLFVPDSDEAVGTTIIGFSYARSEEMLQTKIVAIIGISIFCIIVVGAILYMATKGITNPIHAITDTIGFITKGRLDCEVPSAHRKDEVGAIARAVEYFRESLVERNELEKQAKIEEEKRVARQNRIEELIETFRTRISSTLSSVTHDSEEMKNVSNELSQLAIATTERANEATEAARDASSSVETVAAAAEELSISIKEIGHQLSQANNVVSDSNQKASESNSKIGVLSSAANEIGEVITLIQDIAEQTNLLALNATIESARAGDAGKGFAVVASEVKALANETAKATNQISEQIQEIQAATKQSVVSMEGIGTIIGQLNETSTAIAAAIEEQSSATREITRNIQLAANGTDAVTQNIAGVTDASQEAGVTSCKVLQASDELSQKSDSLKGEVEKFLLELRVS